MQVELLAKLPLVVSSNQLMSGGELPRVGNRTGSLKDVVIFPRVKFTG